MKRRDISYKPDIDSDLIVTSDDDIRQFIQVLNSKTIGSLHIRASMDKLMQQHSKSLSNYSISLLKLAKLTYALEHHRLTLGILGLILEIELNSVADIYITKKNQPIRNPPQDYATLCIEMDTFKDATLANKTAQIRRFYLFGKTDSENIAKKTESLIADRNFGFHASRLTETSRIDNITELVNLFTVVLGEILEKKFLIKVHSTYS